MANEFLQGLSIGAGIGQGIARNRLAQQQFKSVEAERMMRERLLAAQAAKYAAEVQRQQAMDEEAKQAFDRWSLLQEFGSPEEKSQFQQDTLFGQAIRTGDPRFMNPVTAEENRISRESIAEAGRLSREDIAAENRLSREAIAEENRNLRKDITETVNKSREKIAEENRISREKIANERLTKMGIPATSTLGKAFLEKDAIATKLEEAIANQDDVQIEELTSRLALQTEYTKHLSGLKELPPIDVFASRNMGLFMRQAQKELEDARTQKEKNDDVAVPPGLVRKRAQDLMEAMHTRLSEMRGKEGEKTDAQALPKITSKEEFDKLQKGSRFIWTDGKIYVKP